MLKKFTKLVVLFIFLLNVHQALSKEIEAEYGYYNISNPTMKIVLFEKRKTFAFGDVGYDAEPCLLGDKRVCVKSDVLHWFFTVPILSEWEEGKLIKGTHIKMIKRVPIKLYKKSTELWFLEAERPLLGKFTYNYSPHFGLVSFMFDYKGNQVSFASTQIIGYGAIEPFPTED